MISLKAFSVLLHPGYVLLDDQQQARSSILGLQKTARPLFLTTLLEVTTEGASRSSGWRGMENRGQREKARELTFLSALVR